MSTTAPRGALATPRRLAAPRRADGQVVAPRPQETVRRRRRAGVLGAAGAAVVVAAAVAGSVLAHHPPRRSGGLPYPLDIPPARRTPAQVTQARLMFGPHLSATGALFPLPPGWAARIPDLSNRVATRFALTPQARTITYSTFTSWSPDVISVYSDDPQSQSYRLASLSGTQCFMVDYRPGRPLRYGISSFSSRTQARDYCRAALPPASGWHSQWPDATRRYPPAPGSLPPLPSVPPIPTPPPGR